jgi:hypothetical protein
MLRAGAVHEEVVEDIEGKDGLFEDLDYRVYAER